MQELVKSRSVKIILRTLKARKHTEERISLRQTLCLADEINYIHSETVNALVKPPQHHLVNTLAHFLVFPVQVHLLFCKEMKCPLIKIFIIIPRTAAEQRQPVVWRCESFIGSVTPNIIIVIRIIFAFKCLLEPIVLVARMVYNKVNYQLHSSLMNFRQKIVKIFHSAELRHYLLVITNIIAVVIIRAVVKRTAPNRINAQFLQVIEFTANTVKVAYSVTVAVAKGAWINLINNRLFPPFLLHFALVGDYFVPFEVKHITDLLHRLFIEQTGGKGSQ